MVTQDVRLDSNETIVGLHGRLIIVGQAMTTVDEHHHNHQNKQQPQQQQHSSLSVGGVMTGGRNRSFHTIKCYPGGGGDNGTANGGNGLTTNHNSNTNNNNGILRLNVVANNGHVNGKYQPPPSSNRFLSPPSQYQVRPSPHRSQSERNGRWIKVPSMDVSGRESDSSPTIPKVLYRSNSSLDLEQQDFMEDKGVIGALRREYGSASSIDVMSTSGESFFAMLSNYDADKIDQRSPGPAKIAEYLRGRVEVTQNSSYSRNYIGGSSVGGSGGNVSGGIGGVNSANQIVDVPEDTVTSPKTKNKFQRLWETKEKNKGKGGRSGSEPSSSSSSFILRKLRGSGGGSANKGTSDCNLAETSSKGSDNSLDADGRCEEKLRRKAFAHFDVQSLTANLVYASRLRSLLGRRRNTTTGASAASMANRCLAVSTPSGSAQALTGSAEDLSGRVGGGDINAQDDSSDAGDNRTNELLMSCPFFRNELGGEDERLVCLARPIFASNRRSRNASSNGNLSSVIHRSGLSCGLAILEGANETHWKSRTCPYQRHPLRRENVDLGALYYQQYFQGQEHQNWFGIDDTLGPIAVSIRREKIDSSSHGKELNSSTNHHKYRLIIRTSELATLRGSILEEAIPALRQGIVGSGNSSSSSSGGGGNGNVGKSLRVKEVLDYVAPELQLSCLRLGLSCPQTEEQLLKLDQQGLTNHYKVGILYCRAGQSTEEEMYNNEHSGPAFDEFLDVFGQRVRLKGFDKYRAQLDNKTDSTGLYSVYSTYADCEVMFHVSTMLPYSPNNRQQLLRKRHIGNDIVTIVFQEPDAAAFTPRNIRSHFQHVFVIVRVNDPCSENTSYSVAVSRSKEVPVFGPRIPESATFPKSRAFADFLLAKVINAENAAHRSDKFATMATRTRQEYLKDLANNHVSTTSLDTAPKFQILSFGGKKKEKPVARGSRFIPDTFVRGAISWQVQVDDHGRCTVLDCALAISSDALVLVDEAGRDVVFACPCSSVLGWSSHTNSLRVYYHQGECVIVRTKDPDLDEIQEIVSRLSCVTRGCETQEFTLRRNSLGQLGFHVQQDGLITEVEQYGFAWQAGLRHNSRLVEICKVVVSTLTYDQMVDLLKTSMLVTVTVIPPLNDGSPRRGCNLHNCGYLVSRNSNSGGDYENLNGQESDGGVEGRSVRRVTANATVTASSTRCSQITGRHGPSSGTSSSSTRSAKDGVNASSSPTRSTQSSTSSSYGRTTGRSIANLEQRFRAANSEMTSASSQSSDEKWYELGELPSESVTNNPSRKESPPPLPARHAAPLLQSTGNVHHLHGDHSNHQQSGLHGSGNYAHLPPPSGRLVANHGDHQRVGSNQMTRSLNLGSEGSGIDRLATTGGSGGVSGESRSYKNYARVAPFQHNISDQVLHDRLHRLRTSMASAIANSGIKIRPSQSVLSSPGGTGNERQLDFLLDRCQSSRSEDEQSGGSSTSNSLSPRTGRRQPLTTSGASSASSSKNQSPHTVGRNQLDAAEFQKRFGLSNFRGSSESTFQEDLLKLINPDLIDSEQASHDVDDQSTFKRPRTPPIPSKTNSLDRVAVLSREATGRCSTTTPPSVNKVRSTNNISNGSGSRMVAVESQLTDTTPLSGDVIFTTARPATVISTASTSSSPAPSEPKLTKEERLSPRATTTHAAALTSKSLSSLPTSAIMPLPDSSNDIDWPSLVDTATKAMQGELVPGGVTVSSAIGDLIPWIDDVTSRLGLDPLPTANTRRIRELEFRVRILEEELAKERHRKGQLEMEVRNLRDENNRLQEESNTAAAQLRRFTEWFFQAIDN